MDRIDLNLHRTVCWGSLAVAFRRPAEESELLDDLPAAAEALGLPPLPPRGALDALAADYDRLFGHVVRGPCPAHEGEYGEPRGFRFAHEIGDLQGFFRAFGLRPSRRLNERADHISVECEFFAFLALKEACAAEIDGVEPADLCADASRRFLKEHLGRFGRSFAARVRRRARAGFFRAAADLLDAAILADARRLGVEAGPHDLPLREDAGTPDDACVRCCTPEATPR